MSAKFVDLLSLVRSANRDDGTTSGNGGFDTRRRVFEDDRLLGVDAEVGSGEEEWVGEWLASSQSWIIGRDAYRRDFDVGSFQAAVAVCSGTGSSDGVLALWQRVDEILDTGQDSDGHVNDILHELLLKWILLLQEWRLVWDIRGGELSLAQLVTGKVERFFDIVQVGWPPGRVVASRADWGKRTERSEGRVGQRVPSEGSGSSLGSSDGVLS